MKKMIMLLLITGVTCSTSAFAKEAKCKVVIDDGPDGNYMGNCNFEPVAGRQDGSFTLTSFKKNKKLIPLFNIRSATVLIDSQNKNKAKLIYNGTKGSGEIVYRNGACWGVPDTVNNTVCAYAK